VHQLTSVSNLTGPEAIAILTRSSAKLKGLQYRPTTHEARHTGTSATLIASLLSHDIRHHLSVVYCNAEFLSDAATPQVERQELFEELRSAIMDATSLLDFIILQAKNDLCAEDGVESFTEVIERAVSSIRPHPHANGVTITIDSSASLVASFDKILVGSAVYNLVLNACFASRRADGSGKVEVSLCEDHQFIRISVKDNGAGVPPAMKQGLGHPLVTSGKHHGLGLGITIAQYVARDYGGSLQLETSSPGCTVFSLRLAKAALRIANRQVDMSNETPKIETSALATSLNELLFQVT
jgi:K+-sensing histidine kinase KdpD